MKTTTIEDMEGNVCGVGIIGVIPEGKEISEFITKEMMKKIEKIKPTGTLVEYT